MSNFFDKVQAGSHFLAAALSLILGVALVGSGSWCLHRVLGAHSLIYFLYGYSAAKYYLPFENNLENVEILQLLSDKVIVLKFACSTAIIGGIIQVLTSAFILKGENSQKTLIFWTVSSIISSLLSLTSLVLPLAYGLKNFLELHVLFTVSGLNSFIQVHLFAVVIVQIRSIRNNANGVTNTLQSQPMVQISAPVSVSPSSGLPTPPPSPPIPRASGSTSTSNSSTMTPKLSTSTSTNV